MTVLITGATGFIGRRLVESLRAEGRSVRCLVRSLGRALDLQALGAEISAGDLSTGQGLKDAAKGTEACVHLGGVVRAWKKKSYFEINASGTRRMADAASAEGVKKFVLVSSLAAAGPGAGQGRSRGLEPHPVNAYGESKLQAERALAEVEGAMEWTSVRPAVVYGPGDRDVLALFRLASRGVVPYAAPPGARLSLIHVDDLVSLLRASLDRAPPRSVYEASDGHAYSWDQIIEAVARAVGRRVRAVRLSPRILWPVAAFSELLRPFMSRPPLFCLDKLREARESSWLASPEMAIQALAWEPKITLEAGARTTAEWYRERGWLA